MGKVGAVIGTFMYKPLNDRFGTATVMWVQCVLCVLGAVLAHVCIDDNAESGEHPLSRAALLDDDENERGDSSAPETALTRAANGEPKEL